jgi:hypothetical protein
MGHFTVTATTCIGVLNYTAYNTGADVTGATDNRWDIETFEGSNTFVDAKLVTDSGVLSNWTPAGISSGYIGSDQNGPAWSGSLRLRTTVTVTGTILTGAVLKCNVSADDYIDDILVNGVSTGFSGGHYSYKTLFEIPATFFVVGANILDFKIRDTGGFYSSLLVEFV